MYKVLKEDKTHTRVKSNVGDIKVDKDFMDKEIKKHLDNPNLRGRVTTQEMLSFPKVAKNVEANITNYIKAILFKWRVGFSVKQSRFYKILYTLLPYFSFGSS